MTASMTLEPCPFCGAALSLRSPGMNPFGRCDTEGCWMRERSYAVVLDDPAQVRQWNTRAQPDAIETAEKALEQAKETLNAIASWRADSAAYTDSMNLPRRKMGEAQVIHIESEAKRPLKALDAALATIRDNR